MTVLVEKKAAKYLERLPEPDKSRIKEALQGLANEPPAGDIKKLQGQTGYRLRVGGYRVLFDKTETAVVVYKIAPRGQAYKEN
jgi:mRNA interferase RelE/StbE